MRMESYVRRAGRPVHQFPQHCGGWPTSCPGPRAANQKTVAEADFLLVDWGASGRYYKSDLTRVLVTRNNSTSTGEPTEENIPAQLSQIHAIVLRAQRQALAAIRPGVPASSVDAAARAVIVEAGYGDYFGHGLGHGIGLQVHESPAVRPTSAAILEAGMVITVEPGIYLPGWGGVRIEDDVLVTPDGHEVLTSLPRDLPICDFRSFVQ